MFHVIVGGRQLQSGWMRLRGSAARQLWLLLLLVAGLAPGPLAAFTRESVCARQDTINGWSRRHVVDALVLRGLELNKAKKALIFKPASLYVVLLWDKERTTAIELDVPRFPDLGQTGTDERGNRWEVKKGEGC